MEYIDNSSKKINIVGTNNRYMIKKVTQKKELGKKRIESLKWNFSKDELTFENQLKIISEFFFDELCDNKLYGSELNKITKQQISQKISGYKHQDILKKMYDETNFILFKDVINKMIECKLKCNYCSQEMSVLYDISREMKQWTVDRIDNNKGHNKNNFHLACLECNLKRRRQSDEKFLFTKQLNIIQQDK